MDHKKGFYEKYIKRPQDFLCALLACIVLSPVMLVIAIMRMSIMYANSAKQCMTIWAAMSIYVMGVCREMIKIGFEGWKTS